MQASDLAGGRRVLVVANETVGGAELLSVLLERCAGAQVLVVSPALNSRLGHWVSDSDQARDVAQARLDASLAAMRLAGIDARGEIGDADPLLAIADALVRFAADEIVISTHPEGRSNWLERNVVKSAGEQLALPVTHVVVDVNV